MWVASYGVRVREADSGPTKVVFSRVAPQKGTVMKAKHLTGRELALLAALGVLLLSIFVERSETNVTPTGARITITHSEGSDGRSSDASEMVLTVSPTEVWTMSCSVLRSLASGGLR